MYIDDTFVPQSMWFKVSLPILGIMIAYLGRLLIVTEVQSFVPVSLKPGLGALSIPILSLGFGVLLWYALTFNSWFSRALTLYPLLLIGRWSYSIYLFHWYPSIIVADSLRDTFGVGLATQFSSLAVILIITIPLSSASYKMIEAWYFRK